MIVEIENTMHAGDDMFVWFENGTSRFFLARVEEIQKAIEKARMKCCDGKYYHLPTFYESLGLEEMALPKIYCDEINFDHSRNIQRL